MALPEMQFGMDGKMKRDKLGLKSHQGPVTITGKYFEGRATSSVYHFGLEDRVEYVLVAKNVGDVQRIFNTIHPEAIFTPSLCKTVVIGAKKNLMMEKNNEQS